MNYVSCVCVFVCVCVCVWSEVGDRHTLQTNDVFKSLKACLKTANQCTYVNMYNIRIYIYMYMCISLQLLVYSLCKFTLKPYVIFND